MEAPAQKSNAQSHRPDGVEILRRLSPSSQQAILLADHLRRQVEYSSGDYIYTELLLIGLSEAASTTPMPAKSALSAYGIGRRRLVTELLNPKDWTVPRELSFSPTQTGFDYKSLSDLPFSGNALKIIRNADRIATEKGARQIRSRHIFAALLENGNCYATRWLSNDTSFDMQTVIKVLHDAGEDLEITPGLFGFAPGIATADAPARVDTLGFSQATQALAEMILKRETIPPVVFGIYGPWGSGKSTFMLHVKELLEKWSKQADTRQKASLPRIICVTYNAWSYTDASKLWMGLVKEISRRLDAEIKWWQRPFYWLRRSGWKFLGTVLLSLLPVVAGIVWATANPLWGWAQNVEYVRVIVALLGSWGSLRLLGSQRPLSDIVQTEITKLDRTEPEGVINRIQKEFQETVRDYFGLTEDEDEPVEKVNKKVVQSKLKVVVFIDELDRCPLEKIVDILEAIKLFLAEDIFIVLIAVDSRVAAEAIRLHYKEVVNPALAQEYLEKIIQVPIPIPSTRKENLTAYLGGLMSFAPDPAGGSPAGAAGDHVPESRPEEIIQSGSAVRPFRLLNLFDTPEEMNAIADFGQKYLDRNPRRIKRLLNTYRYVKILAHRNGMRVDGPVWQKQMIVWLGATMRWPAFIKKAVQEFNLATGKPSWKAQAGSLSEELRPPDELLADFPKDRETISEYSLLANNFLEEMAV